MFYPFTYIICIRCQNIQLNAISKDFSKINSTVRFIIELFPLYSEFKFNLVLVTISVSSFR